MEAVVFGDETMSPPDGGAIVVAASNSFEANVATEECSALEPYLTNA